MIVYTASQGSDCGLNHIDKEFIYVAPTSAPSNRRLLSDWRPRRLIAGQAPPTAFEDQYGWAMVAKGKNIAEKYKVRSQASSTHMPLLGPFVESVSS